jgi:hypothetical protein
MWPVAAGGVSVMMGSLLSCAEAAASEKGGHRLRGGAALHNPRPAKPAAVPDAAIMLGCGVGWACHRGPSRRPVAPAAAQVGRQPLGRWKSRRSL